MVFVPRLFEIASSCHHLLRCFTFSELGVGEANMTQYASL
jgi:hypothetical protein